MGPITTVEVLVDRALKPRPLGQSCGKLRLQIVAQRSRLALQLLQRELLVRGQRLLKPDAIGRELRFKLSPLGIALIDQVGQTLAIDLGLFQTRGEIRRVNR